MGVTYGQTREDGARRVYFDGEPSGWLMPRISEVLRAESRGIRPAKRTESLYDGGATLINFSEHYARIRGVKL